MQKDTLFEMECHSVLFWVHYCHLCIVGDFEQENLIIVGRLIRKQVTVETFFGIIKQ